jgi:hypothetical protein
VEVVVVQAVVELEECCLVQLLLVKGLMKSLLEQEAWVEYRAHTLKERMGPIHRLIL